MAAARSFTFTGDSRPRHGAVAVRATGGGAAMESSQTTGEPAYPVRFTVEYPDRELNRLSTAFRLIVAIPILIVASSLGGHEGSFASGEHGWKIAGGTGGLLFLAPLLMIVFRQKYPRWWFDWNL